MATDGSLAGMAISLPVRVLSRLFRRLFTEALETAFTAGQLAFFSALAHLKEQELPSSVTWPQSARPNGRSMQSARSPDRSRSASMSATIHTRRHFQQSTHCLISRMARFASSGKIIVAAASKSR